MTSPSQTAHMQQPLIRGQDEAAILGTLIINPHAFEQVIALLRPEHFAIHPHAEVFEAIEAQKRDGLGVITIEALRFHFKEEWDRAFAGTTQTLGQYVSSLPAFATMGDVRSLANEIRNLWASRELIRATETAVYSQGMTSRQALDVAFDGIDAVRQMMLEAEAKQTLDQSEQASIDRLDALIAGQCVDAAVSTGLRDLDNALIGFEPGTIWTVGARPGMGKTTFATASMTRVARQGVGAGLFSMEMPARLIWPRVWADLAYTSNDPVTFSEIIRGAGMTDRKRHLVQRAVELRRQLPFDIDFTSPMTVPLFAARVRLMKRKMAAKGVRLGVVFVDFLKYLKDSDRYKGSRTLEIGDIYGGLRHVAKTEDICIVVLCQLNRQVEGREEKRPTEADLRDSGEIEQDSDVLIFLYREAYYIERDPKFMQGDPDLVEQYSKVKNTLEILNKKSRSGAIGKIPVFCDIGSSYLTDASRDYGGRA